MSRQIVSAFKVLPPFEVLDYPKSIDVKMKTPLGQEMVVTVPLTLLANEQEFINEAQQSITRAQDAIMMEKAATVHLVTPEQLEDIKNSKLKVSDLDTIREESIDQFSLQLSLKTLDTVD